MFELVAGEGCWGEEGRCSSPVGSLGGRVLLQLALWAGRREEGCSSLLGRKGRRLGGRVFQLLRGKGVREGRGGACGEEGCSSMLGRKGRRLGGRVFQLVSGEGC